jgi:hypothetical protein
MHATLRHLDTLTTDCFHNAFTSLAMWRNHAYCAYRQAPSHGITPPGTVVIQRQWTHADQVWEPTATLVLPGADCRDPRLVATEEALYCFLGAYLPAPQHAHWHGLSAHSSDNLIVSYVAHTTDGATWSPPAPIARVNTWIWSALPIPLDQDERGWFACGYYGGRAGECSSLALYGGLTPWTLEYGGLIYDGISYERSGEASRYPHHAPSEPVLWSPAPATLACCVRTNTAMDIGVSHVPYQDWRWHNTTLALHPSAVLQTTHGTLLAARHVKTEEGMDLRGAPSPGRRITWSTRLYWLPPGEHVPVLRLILPSAGDTGYAGLCATEDPDTILLSYYSQHCPDNPARTAALPGAQVYVATIRLKD